MTILYSYTIYEKECGEENALNRKQDIISIIYSLLDMRKENSYTVSKLDCGLILQEQPRNCTACNAPNKNRKRRLIFIVLSVLVMFVLSTVLMSIEKWWWNQTKIKAYFSRNAARINLDFFISYISQKINLKLLYKFWSPETFLQDVFNTEDLVGCV